MSFTISASTSASRSPASDGWRGACRRKMPYLNQRLASRLCDQMPWCPASAQLTVPEIRGKPLRSCCR